MMIPMLAPRDIRLITIPELEQIPGEKMLLLSMLQNLVENAARASSDGTDITVRIYNRGGSAEQSPQGELSFNESVEGYPIMEVSDTGCGMDTQDIKRIMEPFYRVDKSRSRRFGGVGLGLSIVSQIVSLHSAKIEIDSEPGEGTIFRIHFTTF
jgi:signal transduction histidine kinase